MAAWSGKLFLLVEVLLVFVNHRTHWVTGGTLTNSVIAETGVLFVVCWSWFFLVSLFEDFVNIKLLHGIAGNTERELVCLSEHATVPINSSRTINLWWTVIFTILEAVLASIEALTCVSASLMAELTRLFVRKDICVGPGSTEAIGLRKCKLLLWTTIVDTECSTVSHI